MTSSLLLARKYLTMQEITYETARKSMWIHQKQCMKPVLYHCVHMGFISAVIARPLIGGGGERQLGFLPFFLP
jgi:predicted ATP-grasp superfamily ATP-dependent carboligase